MFYSHLLRVFHSFNFFLHGGRLYESFLSSYAYSSLETRWSCSRHLQPQALITVLRFELSQTQDTTSSSSPTSNSLLHSHLDQFERAVIVIVSL